MHLKTVHHHFKSSIMTESNPVDCLAYSPTELSTLVEKADAKSNSAVAMATSSNTIIKNMESRLHRVERESVFG